MHRTLNHLMWMSSNSRRPDQVPQEQGSGVIVGRDSSKQNYLFIYIFLFFRKNVQSFSKSLLQAKTFLNISLSHYKSLHINAFLACSSSQFVTCVSERFLFHGLMPNLCLTDPHWYQQASKTLCSR